MKLSPTVVYKHAHIKKAEGTAITYKEIEYLVWVYTRSFEPEITTSTIPRPTPDEMRAWKLVLRKTRVNRILVTAAVLVLVLRGVMVARRTALDRHLVEEHPSEERSFSRVGGLR